MIRRKLSAGALFWFFLSCMLSLHAQTAQNATQSHWPSFRGPYASGIAEGFPTPIQWDVEASKNVRWKTPIPGLGHSSPIIWGDKLFVTSTLGEQGNARLRVGLYGNIEPVDDSSSHSWHIYCLDKQTGKVLWDKEVHRGVPKIKRHPKATHANSTLATDGHHLVAFFGSEGLYCYDMDGNLVWKKDLGVLDSGYYVVPEAQWEFASSPIIHNGRVIVQCDVQKGSFVAAFNVSDGTEIWRTARDEVPTWSTPTIYNDGRRTQVIVNGYKHIGGYDFATGDVLWKLRGGGDIPIPTPVVAKDLIVITNAHGRMAPIYAIRPHAKGDISLKDGTSSNNFIAWSTSRDGGYMITPIVYGDYVYNCRNNGVLSCYRLKTGERLYQQRLADGRTGFTASPVAADGKIYFPSEEGDIYVVKAGPEFELLAENPMDEICMATPAISEGALFFRTPGHLVAIAENAGN